MGRAKGQPHAFDPGPLRAPDHVEGEWTWEKRFAAKLTHCRVRAGLSQQTVADALGVSRASVNAWEAARTMPAACYVTTLSEILEVPLCWLMGAHCQCLGHHKDLMKKARRAGNALRRIHETEAKQGHRYLRVERKPT